MRSRNSLTLPSTRVIDRQTLTGLWEEVRWSEATEEDRRRSLIAALQGGHLGTVYALQPSALEFRSEVKAVDLTVAEALEVPKAHCK